MATSWLHANLKNLEYIVAYAMYLREHRHNAGSLKHGTIRAKILYFCRFAIWLIQEKGYTNAFTFNLTLENQAWQWLQGQRLPPSNEHPTLIEILTRCSAEDLENHLERCLQADCNRCGSGAVTKTTISVIKGSIAHFYEMLNAMQLYPPSSPEA